MNDDSARQKAAIDYRWLAIVMVVGLVSSGLIGGLVQYAVVEATGSDVVLYTVDVGGVVGMFVFAIALGYLAGDEVKEVISRV